MHFTQGNILNFVQLAPFMLSHNTHCTTTSSQVFSFLFDTCTYEFTSLDSFTTNLKFDDVFTYVHSIGNSAASLPLR